jgi:hypothetical protein
MPSSNFVDDYHLQDNPYDEDESDAIDIYNEPLEYVDWTEWYSNDLMNMWMGMKGYLRDSYLEKPMMGDMNLDDFCSFMYTFSSGKSSRRAT